MAREDEDAWKRRRQREDEAEAEEAKKKAALNPEVVVNTDRIEELLDRAEPLVDQLDSLYNQYMRGMQDNPPGERRKQLDQLMTTIQMMAKPTSSLQFRSNNISSRYVTHRDRWDRMLRDIESGKIKRPNRGGRRTP